MLFYLGTHKPHFLKRTDAPLFVSRRRLIERKGLIEPRGRWALDSGGFSELSLFGRWTVGPEQYVREVRLWHRYMPGLDWAAAQDWMCEPEMLVRTGKTVAEHQRLTIESYLTLRGLGPELPWAPVLQGYTTGEYLAHLRDYERAGIDLRQSGTVGLGSVCRRQHLNSIVPLARDLHAHGLRLHAFGFKIEGVRNCHPYLKSADSMAWSKQARYERPLPGCRHPHCNNCLRYALAWREKVLAAARPLDGTSLFLR